MRPSPVGKRPGFLHGARVAGILAALGERRVAQHTLFSVRALFGPVILTRSRDAWLAKVESAFAKTRVQTRRSGREIDTGLGAMWEVLRFPRPHLQGFTGKDAFGGGVHPFAETRKPTRRSNRPAGCSRPGTSRQSLKQTPADNKTTVRLFDEMT
jgi:hypothetical protein